MRREFDDIYDDEDSSGPLRPAGPLESIPAMPLAAAVFDGDSFPSFTTSVWDSLALSGIVWDRLGSSGIVQVSLWGDRMVG